MVPPTEGRWAEATTIETYVSKMPVCKFLVSTYSAILGFWGIRW